MPASRKVLTLLILAALAVCIGCHLPLGRLRTVGWRLLHLARRLRRTSASRPLAAAPAELLGSPDLFEVAFDYQRAVLELEDIDAETKNRALFLVNRVIIPLFGRVRFADLTPRLEEGMVDVLAAQSPADPEAAIYVFRDLVCWGRVHSVLPRPSRRSFGDS